GAYLEVLADALGSVGVIVAAVLRQLTGSALWGRVVAVAIAVCVVVRAVGLGRRAFPVLAQHPPAALQRADVRRGRAVRLAGRERPRRGGGRTGLDPWGPGRARPAPVDPHVRHGRRDRSSGDRRRRGTRRRAGRVPPGPVRGPRHRSRHHAGGGRRSRGVRRTGMVTAVSIDDGGGPDAGG